MNGWKQWKNADAEYARDYRRRMDEMTPEPLFESFHLPRPKICLRCGRSEQLRCCTRPGHAAGLTLCARCAADWNLSSYAILKGVRANTLTWRLLQFKLKHPFSRPSVSEIYEDVKTCCAGYAK